MKVRRARGTMLPTGLVAVAVALTSAAVGLVAAPAGATPQTKWYTATVGQSASTTAPTVVYPASTPSPTLLYLKIANDAGSNQAFGSADIDLRYNWSWTGLTITTSNGASADAAWAPPVSYVDASNNHLIHLRNNGIGSQYAIPPDGWLVVQLTFNTQPGGIDAPGIIVKQSNDFSDSSTRNTSNVFGTQAASPTIYVGAGPPTQLVYTQNPSDVQMTTGTNDTHYMCPPVKAAVEDIDGNIVNWLTQTAVTLSSTGTPGLKLDGNSTLSADTVNGVATFGAVDTTGSCISGLTAANQGFYSLTASTTVAAGAGYTGGTFTTSPVAYNVYLQPCAASCNVDIPGGTQTNANVNGTNGPTTNTPLFGSIGLAETVPSGCADAHIKRPEQTDVLLDAHDKSITLAWSKKVTNLDPRNGTPFWPVCIQGPYFVYVSDGAGGATTGDATAGALLVLCSTTGVQQRVAPANPGPDHACISSLYKNAASEHAVIWVPDQPGDPHMW